MVSDPFDELDNDKTSRVLNDSDKEGGSVDPLLKAVLQAIERSEIQKIYNILLQEERGLFTTTWNHFRILSELLKRETAETVQFFVCFSWHVQCMKMKEPGMLLLRKTSKVPLLCAES